MIDWPTIKAESSAVIALIADLAPKQVKWRDEAQGGVFQLDPLILLSVNTVLRQGTEEEIATFVNAQSDQQVTVRGQRRFMLSVRAESFEQDIASPKNASNVCQRIQTRLHRSSTLARISSFAVEVDRGINTLEYWSDGRKVSCAVLDIQCRTVDNDLDTTAGAGGWIGEAQITGTVDAVVVSEDVQT